MPKDLAEEQDQEIFRQSIRDVIPLRFERRVVHVSESPTVPVQSLLDEHEALAASRRGPINTEQLMESGIELVFLRSGFSRDILKKLRRGHWVVQDNIDLHGLNRNQAKIMTADFLIECRRHRQRCVKIIHGKGLRSPDKQPVLKSHLHSWLSKRSEIIAYCQAPPHLGGSGALLVLLSG